MESTQANYNKYTFRHLFAFVFNLVIVVTPFILVLLPVSFFDTGQSVCLSKLLAGVECYGCGMTRGIMHLIHLDFIGAWQFNKLSYVVLPMLFPLWLKSLYHILGRKLPAKLDKLM